MRYLHGRGLPCNMARGWQTNGIDFPVQFFEIISVLDLAVSITSFPGAFLEYPPPVPPGGGVQGLPQREGCFDMPGSVRG